MEKMRKEMQGVHGTTLEIVPQIDAILLLDRSVDFLACLSTQLTYEGLINEIFGVKYSKLRCFFVVCIYTVYPCLYNSLLG